MPDLWMDVDTALAEVPVNIFPLLDATDFKTIENAVAYNAAGMALFWHFQTTAGAYTVTAVTPTTGGNYDWTDQGDSGIYTIEIPASGGASINNDTEGFGWFTGSATGVLPWRGPTIGFRRAALNDMFIDGSTASTNLEDFFDGTGYAGGTAKLGVDVVQLSGDTTAANNAEAFFDGTGYAGTNNVIPTVTTVNGLANGSITAAVIATGAIDADAIADNAIDAGAIATGAITSAKFAAGAIDAAAIANGAIDAATFAADVDAEVAAYIWNAATASYGTAGTYGALIESGNVGGGAIVAASVTGAVGSVTGAVGSVTGNVGGNVTGSVGSVAAGGITAASIATGAIDADAIAADAVTEIADGVWDEALSGHSGAGSAGAALTAAGSAGDPWSTALPGAYGAGTAGKALSDVLADTADMQPKLGTPAGASISADIADIEGKVDDVETELAKVPKSDGTATWNATALASIEAECEDALQLQIPDSVPADGTRPSTQQATYMTLQRLIESVKDGTTMRIKKPDGSTDLYTCTLDDADAPTSITRAS